MRKSRIQIAGGLALGLVSTIAAVGCGNGNPNPAAVPPAGYGQPGYAGYPGQPGYGQPGYGQPGYAGQAGIGSVGRFDPRLSGDIDSQALSGMNLQPITTFAPQLAGVYEATRTGCRRPGGDGLVARVASHEFAARSLRIETNRVTISDRYHSDDIERDCVVNTQYEIRGMDARRLVLANGRAWSDQPECMVNAFDQPRRLTVFEYSMHGSGLTLTYGPTPGCGQDSPDERDVDVYRRPRAR